MADSRVQHEVEDWIVRNALPAQFGQSFSKRRWGLEWGGFFEFDGVSEDGTIVACVSTSVGATASGKNPSGKILKIKADTLYLMAARADMRLLVFTDSSMMNRIQREQDAGRFPGSVELLLVHLPDDLEAKLNLARAAASREVTPGSAPL